MRQRKSCASSSGVGRLNAAMCTPAGSTCPTTWPTVPPLPEVSMPCSTSSTLRGAAGAAVGVELLLEVGEPRAELRERVAALRLAALEAGCRAGVDRREVQSGRRRAEQVAHARGGTLWHARERISLGSPPCADAAAGASAGRVTRRTCPTRRVVVSHGGTRGSWSRCAGRSSSAGSRRSPPPSSCCPGSAAPGRPRSATSSRPTRRPSGPSSGRCSCSGHRSRPTRSRSSATRAGSRAPPSRASCARPTRRTGRAASAPPRRCSTCRCRGCGGRSARRRSSPTCSSRRT